MPLPMVHLCVAKNMLEQGYQPKDLSQFYMGSISPDAIHMRKDADRLDKNKTHLMPKGKKWVEINESDYFDYLKEFVASNKEKAVVDFMLGYCAHILTDMYWSRDIFSRFVDDYKKDTSPIQEERWAYYNDTDILDQVLFNESTWRVDIWQYLHSAEESDFLDLLSGQEINAWKERTLHWYDSVESQQYNPIRYITKTSVLAFINACPRLIMKSKIFML